MKVLGHVHTFNDAEVVDDVIRALSAQSYPLAEIILVDNASTDETLDRVFPENVTVIRHPENRGTNGSVITGFSHAIEQDYDWIYILDADSLPAEDAVEKLVRLYEGFPSDLQEQILWLGSLPRERDDTVHHGCVFTEAGVQMVKPDPDDEYYECHVNMWTGTMFRIDAVKKVGLPDPRYFLDWGDIIYTYEGMRQGYRSFIHQSSVVLHNLHPLPTLQYLRFGGRSVKIFYSSPIRFYYFWRNTTFFWLHKFYARRFSRHFIRHLYRFLVWFAKTLLFVKRPAPLLAAGLRGFWQGVRGNLDNRYVE